MVPARRQLAFTMIELLVVVAIMAILAAMILVAVGTFGENAKKRKTDTIIQAVRQGIELAVAAKGSAISPTEHPFSGSRAPRFPFKRVDGSTVSTTGLAYKGLSTTLVMTSEQNKLLLGTDRFADDRVPLLFGGLRQEIGVLQSLRKVVTKYRLLPMPPKPANPGDPWKVISPVTGTSAVTYTDENKDIDHPFFPNTLIPTKYQDENKNSSGTVVQPPYGLMADSKLALDYLFGNSNVQAELASLKAIYNADPTLPLEANKFQTGIESRSVGGNTECLVYTNYGTKDQHDSKTTKGKYEPGYVCVTQASGTTPINLVQGSNGDTWVKYRLGGLAIYDAWENEILTVAGPNNSYVVMSAGRDGVLAVNPGKNLEIDTELTGDLNQLTFKDDDKDGAKDNQR